MLHSALNFAVGFFGLPIEGKYLQSVTIEADGVSLPRYVIHRRRRLIRTLQYNNTLAPYKTSPNAQDKSKADRGVYFVKEWAKVYLENALARLQPQLKGYELTVEDVYTLQQVRKPTLCSRACINAHH